MGNDTTTAEDKVARDASALLRRPPRGPSLVRGDEARLWPRRDDPKAGMLDVLNRQGDPERERIREMAVAGALTAFPAARAPGAAVKLWRAARPVVKSAIGWAAARAAMAKATGADWKETGREALEGAVEGAAMRVLPGNRLTGARRALADAAKLSLADAAVSSAKGEGAASAAGDAAFTAGASLVMDALGAGIRRTPAPVRLALGALGVAAAVAGDSRDLRDAPGTWGHFIKWTRDPANDGRPYTDYVGGLSDAEAAAYADAHRDERAGDDGPGVGGFMRALHEAVIERASGTRRATGGGDAEEGYGRRFEGAKGLLATDDVPDSLFGIPVVHSRGGWTESDISFFRRHPEAAGFYDLGDGESVDDGSAEGAPRQADEPKDRGKYGLRPDGTPKGDGWLGPLTNAHGNVVTEYSMQSDAVKVDGQRIDFPMLVPGLKENEIRAVLAASAGLKPNKEVFASAQQKAVDFALYRLAKGRSVWAPEVASPEAVAFMEKNPTLFKHVMDFEKLALKPYDDTDGMAVNYGAHTDVDGFPVTKDTREASAFMARMSLARDLYVRRERLKASIPNWNRLSANAKHALLDVSMGADDVLGEKKSGGLLSDLMSTKDQKKLDEFVKNHYYSYRNPGKNTQGSLESRRVAGGKTFFGDTFSYVGKVWSPKMRKFAEDEGAKAKGAKAK